MLTLKHEGLQPLCCILMNDDCTVFSLWKDFAMIMSILGLPLEQSSAYLQ